MRTEIINLITKKTIGLTLVLSVATFAFAQEKVNITGQITDKQHKPVPYASVTFESKANKIYNDAVLTDEKGNFTLALAKGDYEITIEAIDYKKAVASKNIQGGSLGSFVIVAEEAPSLTPTKNIEGIILTAANSKAYTVGLDKKIYNPSTDVISKGGNLQDVLTNVPSVEVDLDGTVSMRGSSNVKFLINGKPSSLLGIDSGSNALQAIPADQIEKIEVITNPSSKYEASGTAGILNIILKTSKSKGFNGSVEGTLGYLPTSRLNTNLSWKNGNWTWYVNGGGGQSRRERNRTNDATYFDDYKNITTTSNQNTDNKNDDKTYNANAGFTVDLSSKTSLNVGGMLRYMENEGTEDVGYLTRDYLTNTLTNSNRLSLSTSAGTSWQGDIGLDHKFNPNGHNISASFSIQRNNKEDENNIAQYEETLFTSRNLVDQQTINKTLIGKLDYELPLGEDSRLEAGYRFDKNENDYNYLVSQSTDNVNYSLLNDFTSRTVYTEMFNAFYAQFKSKINRFGYQLGLRTEITDINISYQNPTSGTTTVSKNYTGFFPSVFLSYDIGSSKNNQLLLNYSRRINRPRSFHLVPFNSFNLNDDRNLFRGNPDLNPEYVNSFELGYAIQKKKFTINPTLYYRLTEDETQTVSLRESSSSLVLVTRPYNVGTETKIGLDLNATGDIFSWWKVMGSVDLYRYKTEGSYFDASLMDKAQSFDGSGFSGRARLTNSFKLDKTFNIQIQTMFRGGEKTASQDKKSEYSVNFGATKTIWNGNGTIAFNIQDIFNTRKMKNTTYGASFERSSTNQFMPRTFMISLSYRFKQGEKIEQKKKQEIKNNSSDDESSMM